MLRKAQLVATRVNQLPLQASARRRDYQPGGLPGAQGTPHGPHDQAASA
jgi:hypothetical protein